ncbi:hypothetical protein E2C01_065818 [Portunus trituberculatus]|uniref:Uncharacterized protein n=1 Tax=Portunus trituberculatus TaxID=210409 RepID=A0A5B7HGL2_PORTR|nr:hypothetical protein [Portunus trituberculatus]
MVPVHVGRPVPGAAPATQTPTVDRCLVDRHAAEDGAGAATGGGEGRGEGRARVSGHPASRQPEPDKRCAAAGLPRLALMFYLFIHVVARFV